MQTRQHSLYIQRPPAHFHNMRWARYDLAKPGSFRLAPPAARIPRLRTDYAAMADMYLNAPMPFDEVVEALTDLERRINAAKP